MVINILNNTLNIGQALKELFPESNNKDYFIYDDGVIIKVEWKLPIPFPSDEIIRTASLEFIRKEKIRDLSAECESRILAGFVSKTTGNAYRFGQYDQLNMTQQMLLMIENPDMTTVDWKTEDAGVFTHNRVIFFEIVKEAEEHKRSHISHYWQLKAIVNNCNTEEEVEAIVWDSV